MYVPLSDTVPLVIMSVLLAVTAILLENGIVDVHWRDGVGVPPAAQANSIESPAVSVTDGGIVVKNGNTGEENECERA